MAALLYIGDCKTIAIRQKRPSVYRINLGFVAFTKYLPTARYMHVLVVEEVFNTQATSTAEALASSAIWLLALEPCCCFWSLPVSFSCLLHLNIAEGNDEFQYLMYFSIVKLGHYYVWRGRIM
ncbi:hypothetical protein FRX31_033639 [Thalictrum thalictroides]|uniref:Uncharacterized protein n=1 Tax=Thalictrum thalictroides TaxID=46969 RepID=A0A7J6UX26_THATH|nr:hypothetical protein FRX31_033639 [Thalictrum thalictroides]